MIRPDRLSRVTIYLNKQLINEFLKDIVYIKDFHVISAEHGGTGLSRFSRDNENVRKDSGILSEEEYVKLDQQVKQVYNNLNQLISEANIKIGEIKKLKIEKRTTIKFDSIQNFIFNLVTETEDLFYKFENTTQEINNNESRLEEIAQIASLLHYISKYGINKRIDENTFNHLNFSLYTTNRKHFIDLSSKIEEIKIPLFFHGEEIGPDIYGIFVFYDKDFSKDVSELFLNFNCKKFQIPEKYLDDKGIHIDVLTKDHDEALEQRNLYEKAYSELVNNLSYRIMTIYESLLNAIELLRIYKGFKNTPTFNIAKIEGYIPKKIESKFINAFKKQFKKDIHIDVVPVKDRDPYEPENSKDESKEEGEKEGKEAEEILQKHEKVPTLIKFKGYFKPYTVLTDLYGTTNYSEIDPTFIMAFSFPILFGLMFGDIGHGLVLFFVGLFGYFKYKNTDKKGSRDLSIIISISGLSSIFTGLLFGEFFGEPFYIGSQRIVLWGDPIEIITKLIKFSLYIGVFMVSLGFSFKFINLFKNHKRYRAFVEPLPKILTLLGGTKLLFTYNFQIEKWLSPPYPILWVVIPSLFVIIGPMLGKIFRVSYYKHEKMGSLISEYTLDLGETFLQLMSNTASFLRLIAMEMAHIGLMIVIKKIEVLLFPNNIILGLIVIGIAGNAFVIGLELIIVLIQDIRLHFYEFFSKFYVGNGVKFRSISLKSDFTTLEFVRNQNIAEFEF
ncbi:MAG: V-type ATPase 116kDa subunit family protein [Promethearchaeota archaeon]